MATELIDAPRTRRRPLSSGLVVGRVLGIDIVIDPSWIFIAVLVVFSLGSRFTAAMPHLPSYAGWLAGLAGAVLFFLSILTHEMAHSLVARARGIEVHDITLFIFGGMSRMAGDARRPLEEFTIAIVGPLTSAVLAVFFQGIAWLGAPESPVAIVAGWLGLINAALAVFNLLPGFPLDGGRVLRAAAWAATGSVEKADRVAVTSGTLVGMAFMALGVVLVALGVMPLLDGIWLAIIGWFLLSAVRATRTGLRLKKLLGRLQVRQAMSSDCTVVSPEKTVRDLVEDNVFGGGRDCLFVAEGTELKGIVTPREIQTVPVQLWSRTPVRGVMVPLGWVRSVRPTDSLARAMAEMQAAGTEQLAVVDDGELIGVLTRDEMLRVALVHLELRRHETQAA